MNIYEKPPMTEQAAKFKVLGLCKQLEAGAKWQAQITDAYVIGFKTEAIIKDSMTLKRIQDQAECARQLAREWRNIGEQVSAMGIEDYPPRIAIQPSWKESQ